MRRIFLHCVDSRVEESGVWYSRLHLGPFPNGLATTLAIALRRTRLTDLPYLGVQAVEIEGAAHEYSRLVGVHEPVLDLLLRFRERARTGEIQASEQQRGFFEVRGPGVFRAGDLRLPPGVSCVNPKLVLAHLAPGAILRGRVLLEQIDPVQPTPATPLSESWLPVTTRTGPLHRVGFRIEDAGPFEQGGELIIFEITTNGTLSPQQALRQASERLVRLFLGIVGVDSQLRLSKTSTKRSLSRAQSLGTGAPTVGLRKAETASQASFLLNKGLGSLAMQGYRRFSEPLGLDLGNLDLSFSTYQYFRTRGIATRGELVNLLATESLPSEHTERYKEARKALLRFGLFSFS